ncbi:eye-specific diacylglycerol kinase isoform X2 [Cimex lectularius]|uniref:Diacylglycerol kinase n=1 Tax=Cimex lectularius TaxID=79782 RepID=A0A8I6SFB2_CIMLE|nr:eye-specific diacylglycerol kinase isoform X2 [Cimex lectularius]
MGDNKRKHGSDIGLVSSPNWDESALEGEHIWYSKDPSEKCYMGESECKQEGTKLKCSACKMVAHTSCISEIAGNQRFHCKPTFKDAGLTSYREDTKTKHHWIHRRTQKGKCHHCGKAFQSKLPFCNDKIALRCSWCQISFHNKDNCFNAQKREEDCNLGIHSGTIVPPSWIVKLPRKSEECDVPSTEKAFTVKPIPTTNMHPVIVFINPKSGGNQGHKLLQKFHWLLNPRQVFDLTQGGPKMGLQLYRKVPYLRVLACGGDGTVGWILSEIDQLDFNPPPPVGVLPLGTGNDLARDLGWGGGYSNEPMSKILRNVSLGDVVHLDRWELKVEKNPNATEAKCEGKDNLSLNVVNNYFSLGVDAHIALQFHEAREAHPEKFTSRLRNKIFYGQMGGKDLLKRKWKGLAEFVTLVCDGKDLTSELKKHKFHAIVFLNIASYGGGAKPWPPMDGMKPSTDDGLIEVVGLTTYQLPLLQAGGHGTGICQCKSAVITTFKTIPMQVDGEACKLNPSIITMSFLNKAPMVAKRGRTSRVSTQTHLEPINIGVQKINIADYEEYQCDTEHLKKAAINIGQFEVDPMADLEQIRHLINSKMETQNPSTTKSEWCYLDTCTAEKFFKIDRAQEHSYYITDIASDSLYILNCEPIKVNIEEKISNLETSSVKSNQRNCTETSEGKTTAVSPYLDSAEDKILDSVQVKNTENNIHEKVKADEKEETNISYKSILLEKTTDSTIQAAKEGDIRALVGLHKQGYSLLSIDSSGQTALHYAARNGHKNIVKYLIACAPYSIIDMVDNERGQTALHKATFYGHSGICCMLVAAGASLTQPDNFGKTPKLLAIERKDHQLASYLESQESIQLVREEYETKL